MLLRIYRIASLLGAIVWALLGGGARCQLSAPLPIRSGSQSGSVSGSPSGEQVGYGRAPATTLGGVLRDLTMRSGVVFLGRVRSIAFATTPMADMQSGVVTITLDVLAPIAGDPGSTYVLREWSGLWTMGRQRYTVGQRALFFLHARNDAGLSSPVDGMLGVVPLVPTAANADPLLDIRWLATRVQRAAGAPIAYAGTGGIRVSDAARIVTHPEEMLEPTPVALPAGMDPSAASPVRPRPIVAGSAVAGGAAR